MTTKRKKKKTVIGGRAVTVAFSLGLLAVITMMGMYTVGKSDQQQAELEQQAAEAEELAKAQQEAYEKAREEARERELEEQKKEAASASAQRQKEESISLPEIADGAELESEFAVEETEMAETIVIEEIQETEGEAVTEQPLLSFSPDSDTLLWPIAGNIILDYSMDKSVYFTTLDQYKYNPAVIIQGSLDESVLCGAQGKVSSIETLEETGTTLTLDIGDGYELIYGQLKELAVDEGEYVNAGETIGYVSEPTRFYSKEGCNVYFEVRKDGESIDPMLLLQ